MDNRNTDARVTATDIDEVLTKVRRYSIAVSMAARGLKTVDGMALDEAYEAIEELAWDAAMAAGELQDSIRAQDEAELATRRAA